MADPREPTDPGQISTRVADDLAIRWRALQKQERRSLTEALTRLFTEELRAAAGPKTPGQRYANEVMTALESIGERDAHAAAALMSLAFAVADDPARMVPVLELLHYAARRGRGPDATSPEPADRSRDTGRRPAHRAR